MINLEEPLAILIVEDIRDVAESIEIAIRESDILAECTIQVDFEQASTQLQQQFFDIIILDIYQGDVDIDDAAGEQVWMKSLSPRFIPVIIYTAGELYFKQPYPKNNPILQYFKKVPGSEKKVAEHIRTILPFLKELRRLRLELNESVRKVIIDTAPYLWEASQTDKDILPEVFLRSTRRRIAALMDYNLLTTDRQMKFWEQYIIPPLGETLLTGDLLIFQENDPTLPSSYCIVLTPSCDLTGKVDCVLVAECVTIKGYIKALGITINDDNISKRNKARLKTELTLPHSGGYVFLPKYANLIPSMCANLRSLKLINLNDINLSADPDKDFIRVASLDSPFREQISWAYLQISGRPGIPDRDLEKCIDENFVD